MDMVDAVAGTIVDPHFDESSANAPGVTGISQLHAADPADDPRHRIGILQTAQPI